MISKQKKTTFKNPKFIPTVTYFDPNFYEFRTTTISEYNNELAANHWVTSQGMDITKEWVQSYVQQVIGQPEGIELVLN